MNGPRLDRPEGVLWWGRVSIALAWWPTRNAWPVGLAVTYQRNTNAIMALLGVVQVVVLL